MSLNTEIEFIRDKIVNLPSTEIIKIYSIIADHFLHNNYIEKVKSILLIINMIFKQINKAEITKLDEFCYIKKSEFFTEESNKIVEENIHILFGPFCKTKYKYYMRASYKKYFYSFLRNACLEVGYELINIKIKKETHLSISKNS